MTNPSEITSVAELLAHAHAMEAEAAERYAELAEQMEVHHNPEVAALFRKMAQVERDHVAKILARVGSVSLPRIPPWEYKWPDNEAPQSVTVTDAHYMMTSYHALEMALAAEMRALDFYRQVAESPTDPETAALARELAEEEEEHVALIRARLAKHPKPEEGWDDDMDPPQLQE